MDHIYCLEIQLPGSKASSKVENHNQTLCELKIEINSQNACYECEVILEKVSQLKTHVDSIHEHENQYCDKCETFTDQIMADLDEQYERDIEPQILALLKM